MVIDVVMPKMGESITEGTILEWYKNCLLYTSDAADE